MSVRVGLPRLAEGPELAVLDAALQLRARLGFASALDPSIRFVEMSSEDVARSADSGGEYALAGSVLRTLSSLGVRAVAVDVIYTFGSVEDQRMLAAAAEEARASGFTSIVLAASAATAATKGEGPAEFVWSLPDAGGAEFEQGIVNVAAGKNWREYRLVHRYDDKTVPSLAMAAFGAMQPAPLAPQVSAPGRMEWRTLGSGGGVETASADESRLFLNLQHSYYDERFDEREGVRGRVWTIGQLEALASRSEGVSPLLDTVVFLGYGAGEDGRPTAHGNLEPGMLLHATALSDLLHGSAIRPVSFWLDFALLVLVAAVAAAVFATARRKRWLILGAVFGALLLVSAGLVAVWHFSRLPSTANAALLWVGVFLVEGGRRWAVEQRARLQRDAMLGFYFSPAVLRQVTKDLDMIRPRGAEVAVLLSDLRGFTTLCETQPVERVFELLNRLFSVETEAALREDGSLSRFAGDQFLAYWGAPDACDDPAARALRAALRIQRELDARRESPGDDLDSWLRIGIGLHAGRGLVGHVGSRSYRDYNIVGDSVNTTARIEGQTKNYGASILASGEFIKALSEIPTNLVVDRVQMKGKARATNLHAVFDGPCEDFAEGFRDYEAAFDRYLSGDFALASATFARLGDHPCAAVSVSARLLGERCDRLFAEAPEHWDGVFVLDSK